MRIVVDCTELHENPVRTGIQRVVRELLRHWPDRAGHVDVARFEAGRGLVTLDRAAVRLLLDEDGADRLTRAELSDALRRHASGSRVLEVAPDAVVFVPEVFFDPERAAFHERRRAANPDSLAMLGYDFLPWLRPGLFGLRTSAHLMAYLRLIRDARHVAFISAQTQREHAARIRRGADAVAGPVLPLGADGLRMERQSWSLARRDFVALGSIDGRKNQHRIVEAFRLLWDRGQRAGLTLVGRAFEGEARQWLREASAYPDFRWIEDANDEAVASVLSTARATIYVSAAEGFGLPPVESLMVGIPVVATDGMPSLETLPTGGQIRLEEPDPVLIADAVSGLLDDGTAEALWRGAASLRLGTWKNFGEAAARWITGVRDRGSPGVADASATPVRPDDQTHPVSRAAPTRT